jgi:hypothetical protein
MTHIEMATLLRDVSFPGYEFGVTYDSRGSIYLQARYLEPDTTTYEPTEQFTRRWLLSPEMTRSEIVQTAFKCVLTSMEHKTREWFHFRGRPVYGPHFDVDALYNLCAEYDFDTRK